jgi:hypothetical protein
MKQADGQPDGAMAMLLFAPSAASSQARGPPQQPAGAGPPPFALLLDFQMGDGRDEPECNDNAGDLANLHERCGRWALIHGPSGPVPPPVRGRHHHSQPREKGLFLKQNKQAKKCEIQVTDT